MEVQEVTVYVNNQQNEGAIKNKLKFDENFNQATKLIPSNSDGSNQGSILVQNAPNIISEPSNDKNTIASNNFIDGKAPSSPDIKVIF